MTRYKVTRFLTKSQALGAEAGVHPHPDQPEDGFGSWTEAEIWLQERFLPPHIWRVEPFAETEP